MKRLMTISGVDITVALAMKGGDRRRVALRRSAEARDLSRVEPKRPAVRPGPAYHGRITKQGRGHARGMLVEAAWAAARAPGPLRAFSLRRASPARTACRGRGNRTQTLCRDLASVEKGESYAWARPSLHAKKLARCGTQGREQGCARPKGSARPGKKSAAGWSRRGRLCTPRRRLEPTRSEEGRHGCRKRGATIEAARQGSHLGPCSSPRGRPARQENSADLSKRLLSITSVVLGAVRPGEDFAGGPESV